MNYSKNKVIKAMKYLEDFNVFAKRRMYKLQYDISTALGDNQYISRSDLREIRVDYVDDSGILMVIFRYGWYDCSSSETLVLPLDVITMEDDAWEVFCEKRIKEVIDDKKRKIQIENEESRQRKIKKYLKLKEELEGTQPLQIT